MIYISENELNIVIDIIKKYIPHCEVRVFGSRYKQNYKDYSDLDLAIVGETKLGLKLIEDLREAFQESELNFRVDLLDWHGISPEFRKLIENGYEVIWSGRC